MSAKPITEESIQLAVRELSNSETGRQALGELFQFFDGSAGNLDSINRSACCTLINAFWGGFPGTVIEEVRKTRK